MKKRYTAIMLILAVFLGMTGVNESISAKDRAFVISAYSNVFSDTIGSNTYVFKVMDTEPERNANIEDLEGYTEFSSSKKSFFLAAGSLLNSSGTRGEINSIDAYFTDQTGNLLGRFDSVMGADGIMEDVFISDVKGNIIIDDNFENYCMIDISLEEPGNYYIKVTLNTSDGIFEKIVPFTIHAKLESTYTAPAGGELHFDAFKCSDEDASIYWCICPEKIGAQETLDDIKRQEKNQPI